MNGFDFAQAVSGTLACSSPFVALVLIVMRTSRALKWISLGFALVYWGSVMWVAVYPEADVPPCHLMAFLPLACAPAYRHWLHPTRPKTPPNHCSECGYDLTGNVSRVCPECGSIATRQQNWLAGGVPPPED